MNNICEDGNMLESKLDDSGLVLLGLVDELGDLDREGMDS